MNKNKKKEDGNNIVCFYPERALQKAISKSNVRTVIALANRKQGQSYMFEPLTTLFVPCACFYFFKKCPYSIERNSMTSGMFGIKRTLSNRDVRLMRSLSYEKFGCGHTRCKNYCLQWCFSVFFSVFSVTDFFCTSDVSVSCLGNAASRMEIYTV